MTKRSWIGGISALVGLAVLGWQVFERYWYYMPGLLASFRDPVGPTRAVTWQAGPETPRQSAAARPPNVVVIVADDLGWNDLTFNGGGVANGAVPTPHINAIGREGVTYSMGFAGNATCAPSRAAMLTGRYATRFGFEFTPVPKDFSRLLGHYPNQNGLESIYHSAEEKDVPNAMDDMAVPTSEVMIGQVMQTRGYHTMMLGKWHLGGSAGKRPEDRGFDEALAFYDGASMYLPSGDARGEESHQDFDPIDKFLWANLRYGVRYNGSQQFNPPGYITDYLGDQAVQAIAANRNRPFFMYLAFNAPHTPLQALKEDFDALPQIQDHRLRVYAAMIRALDRNVGKVMDALKAQGLDDNTMVVFTSDNGGAHYIGLPDINKPFRGWKATFFEGGLHVPFFLRWPAKLPAHAAVAQPIAHVDIFATAAAAAGAAMPHDRVMDGVDLVAQAGRPDVAAHKTLYWRSGGYKVLLAGAWKLQVSARPNMVWLNNLTDDPTEQHNLAATRPDKLAEMQQALADVDGQQAKPLWPSLLEAPVFIDHPLGGVVKPGDEYIYWAN